MAEPAHASALKRERELEVENWCFLDQQSSVLLSSALRKESTGDFWFPTSKNVESKCFQLISVFRGISKRSKIWEDTLTSGERLRTTTPSLCFLPEVTCHIRQSLDVACCASCPRSALFSTKLSLSSLQKGFKDSAFEEMTLAMSMEGPDRRDDDALKSPDGDRLRGVCRF